MIKIEKPIIFTLCFFFTQVFTNFSDYGTPSSKISDLSSFGNSFKSSDLFFEEQISDFLLITGKRIDSPTSYTEVFEDFLKIENHHTEYKTRQDILRVVSSFGKQVFEILTGICDSEKTVNINKIFNEISNIIRADAINEIIILKAQKDYNIKVNNWVNTFAGVIIEEIDNNNNVSLSCKEQIKNYTYVMVHDEIEKAEISIKRFENTATFIKNPEEYLMNIMKLLVYQVKNNILVQDDAIEDYKPQMLELIDLVSSGKPPSDLLLYFARDLIKDLIFYEINYKALFSLSFNHTNLKNLQRFFTHSIQRILQKVGAISQVDLENAFRVGAFYFRYHIKPLEAKKIQSPMTHFYKDVVKGKFSFPKSMENFANIVYFKLKVINVVSYLSNENVIDNEDKTNFLSNFASLTEVNYEYYPFLTHINKLFYQNNFVDFELIPDLFVVCMMQSLNLLSNHDVSQISFKEFPQLFEDFLMEINDMDLKSIAYIPVLRLLNYLMNPADVKSMKFTKIDHEIPEETKIILENSACSNLKKHLMNLEIENNQSLNDLEILKSENDRHKSILRNSNFGNDMKSAEVNEDEHEEEYYSIEKSSLEALSTFYSHFIGPMKADNTRKSTLRGKSLLI
jgi:hypothetical protein